MTRKKDNQIDICCETGYFQDPPPPTPNNPNPEPTFIPKESKFRTFDKDFLTRLGRFYLRAALDESGPKYLWQEQF